MTGFGLPLAAGFLDDTVFFIANNAAGEPSLYRQVGAATTPAEELVPNIANLQVSMGCDIDLNGQLADTEWYYSEGHPAAPSGLEAGALHQVRISLVARSQDPEMIGTWQADPDMPENAADLSGEALRYRYRTISVGVGLRSIPPISRSRI
jgi:hypothetical protein